MNTIINVADTIQSPSALTQEQGDIIYALICDAINHKEIVVLDFGTVESMISPFLNNAIGKLYGTYSSKEINDYLKLCNFPDAKKATLKIVTENAKKYYANKAEFNATLKDVIG